MVQNRHRVEVTLPSDLEVRVTRVFDAPRELVFEAYSKPEHIRRWWARGNEMPVCEMDFRPGGRWRFVERTPDGQEHAFRGEYRDIVRPELIVQTFEYEGHPGQISVETATFEERDGRTVWTGTIAFASKEDRDTMVESGMETGVTTSFERLDGYLRELQSR
jgi:uncharacterized protein YndB with AHSA1/START domain